MQEGLCPLFQEKDIELKLQACPAYIRADYDLFKTLLLNIIDNSVKAGSSRIEISGRLKEEAYCISIKDNGCGMPQEELTRITEAFYMIDKARSRKQHGAGLGLALAEKIARIHGCGLTFESKVNQGTKVVVRIPCSPADDEGGIVK